MNSIKIITPLLLFSLCNIMEAEAETKKQTVQNGTYTILNGQNTRPGRPKLPSKQVISCFYDNGELTLDFAMPEGMCEVVLTECTGSVMSYSIDSSDLSATVYVGTISESTVDLTTENGNTYSGTLSAEF